MKEKNSVITGLKIAFNVVFYSLIVLLLLFSIANIQVRTENDIPHLFGRGFLSVQSDSMVGDNEDSFDEGDIVFVRLLNDERRQELEVGDVITYFDRSIRAFNTHRIVEIYELQGDTFFVTRGDNTPGNDNPIRSTDALAVYSNHWNGFGATLDYLQTPVGFALFIIVPVAIMLIITGIGLTRNILALNKAKLEEKYQGDQEAAKQSLEAEKERMRQELLEEMAKNKDKDPQDPS